MKMTTIGINIVAEVMAIVFLLILEVSILLHKNKRNANKLFRYMVNLSLIQLCFQVVSWWIDYMFLTGNGRAELLHINEGILILDFMLFITIYVVMIQYVLDTIHRVNPFSEKLQKYIGYYRKVLVGLGILSCGIFITSVWSGLLFTYLENGTLIYRPVYLLFLMICLLPLSVPIVLVISSWKALGMGRTIIVMFYVMMPILGLPVDVIFNLSVSYVGFAIVLMIIYIEIDLEFDNELLSSGLELAKREKELADMKVNMMLAQIQPHFLYNTLTSISYLCRENPEEAATATRDFAAYLRGNLQYINTTEPIPFDQELVHTQNYLKIQGRRFEDRMKVEYDIQTEDFLIPALTLQTMVENAVKHAVGASLDPVTIKISSKKEADHFLVCIEDNGPGFSEDQPLAADRPHIGISSTRERIHSLAGGTFEIASALGKGTCVRITIPDTMEILG